MGVIFFYSSRPAEISGNDSFAVGKIVGRLFVPGFEEKTEEEQLEFAMKIDHPVRKTAHATEYAALGFLFAGACYPGKGKQRSLKRTLLLPWCMAAAYAMSDEIHQTFVPGRSGQVSDVCLDSAGALVGVLIIIAIFRVFNNLCHVDHK